MANASAKRIANRNDSAVKTLKLGMILPTVISLFLRLLLRRNSLPPSKGSLALYFVTFLPVFFLSNYLIKIGTARRDPTTGTLLSYGEDLGQPGVMEWCFDVLYVTWTCQIGSGAFGEWFWWFYLVIPSYAMFKLWTSVISPFFLGRSTVPSEDGADNKETVSKRQEKLRKRGERGDARIRAQHTKK